MRGLRSFVMRRNARLRLTGAAQFRRRDRLSHQTRQGEMGQNALADNRATPGAKSGDSDKTRSAQQIDREIGNDQRAIEEIDAMRSETDIGATMAIVAGERAGQFPVIRQIDAGETILKIGDVPQTEI